MTENILWGKELNLTYRKGNEEIQALKDVSFTLKQGEILGIIGESGSGKSTLANLIAGLIKADSGRICNSYSKEKECFVENSEFVISRRGRDKDLSIQMIFQDAAGSLNPRMKIGHSIGEYIKNEGRYRGKDLKKKTLGFMKAVGLPEEYYSKYPNELSGGECQRCAIARAISVAPKILICDEATSALDVSVQKNIMRLIIHMKEVHDLSVIFISHDLPLITNVADRIMIMSKGRVVEEGRSEEIVDTPKTKYTKELLDSVLRL